MGRLIKGVLTRSFHARTHVMVSHIVTISNGSKPYRGLTISAYHRCTHVVEAGVTSRVSVITRQDKKRSIAINNVGRSLMMFKGVDRHLHNLVNTGNKTLPRHLARITTTALLRTYGGHLVTANSIRVRNLIMEGNKGRQRQTLRVPRISARRRGIFVTFTCILGGRIAGLYFRLHKELIGPDQAVGKPRVIMTVNFMVSRYSRYS